MTAQADPGGDQIALETEGTPDGKGDQIGPPQIGDIGHQGPGLAILEQPIQRQVMAQVEQIIAQGGSVTDEEVDAWINGLSQEMLNQNRKGK